jgi:hypothetical protein
VEGGTNIWEGVPQDAHLESDVLSLEALYGGLMPSQVKKKLRQLEEENTRLRQVVADLMLGRRCFRSWLVNYDATYRPARCSGARDDRIYVWRFSYANRGF